MNRYFPISHHIDWLVDKYYKGQRLVFAPGPGNHENGFPPIIILLGYDERYKDGMKLYHDAFSITGGGPSIDDQFPRIVYITPDGKAGSIHLGNMVLYE